MGNTVYRAKVLGRHSNLIITSRSRVSLRKGKERDIDFPMKGVKSSLLLPTKLVNPRDFSGIAEEVSKRVKTVREALNEVVSLVRKRMVYRQGMTTVNTTATEAMSLGVGVCQDYTHITLGILRAMGIPSSYVMGVVDRDPKTTHAWVEIPGEEPIYADPTRGRLFDIDYIKFAVGRDYRDATPVSGWVAGNGSGKIEELTVEVSRGVD